MKLSQLFYTACLLVGVALFSTAAIAAPALPDPFLDTLQGRWKVTGTFNGHPAKHEFKAEWTFRNGYLRFRDVSEEENAEGIEEFEVIAYIGYDAANRRYVCIWMDNRGTPDPDAAAAATPRVGDSLPFVFKSKDGTLHSTFTYNAKANSWTWVMDNEKNGVTTPYARLTLQRKK